LHKASVKERISLASKPGSGNERVTALRAELDLMRAQQSESKASRGKIFSQLQAIQENIQKKVSSFFWLKKKKKTY